MEKSLKCIIKLSTAVIWWVDCNRPQKNVILNSLETHHFMNRIVCVIAAHVNSLIENVQFRLLTL